MATTYHKANGPDGNYSVVKVTDAPAYSVIAVVYDEQTAIDIAAALS